MIDVPADTPVTTPPNVVTVTLPLLTDHIPPVVVELREMEARTHTADGPLIVPASGHGLTVKGLVAYAVPQPLVTA